MTLKYPMCLLATLLSATTLKANATALDSRDKPFNEYSWVTTHNSYEKINQNLKEMPAQLNDGVRGFMLDLYVEHANPRPEARIKVCHKQIACYGPFAAQLKNEFLPFLQRNPGEVITLFLETYVGRDDLQKVFNTLPELGDVSFDPAHFAADQWPTINQMAARNNRLIMLADKREVAGDYWVRGKKITVLFDQDWIVQNHWATLGNAASSIESAHNWSCPTRWGNLPLSTKAVATSTGKQWKRLFLMNQFHPGTSTIFDSAAYDNNLTYLKRREDNCGVKPNYVGINNYKSGETERYTSALNNGGIYLHEGPNATRAQDLVCVIPVRPGVVNLSANGCENDEARSMSLSGVAKGTRIQLYDNASGNTQDDHMIVDIMRDIGIHERVVLPSFEADVSNTHYRAVHNRNNGLNGKVSRVVIGKTPTDFSDATVAFYEGNNASQNLDCVIPFNFKYTMKLSSRYGCSNDEIKSAKIIKAKAGTSFTLTGSPEGGYSQGRVSVQILRDITSPIVIPTFNSSYSNADVNVTNYKEPVGGKVSFAYINGAP
jgi:hypothetical protein